MNEACIDEAIEDSTVGICVLKQHASDEPEDIGVDLKGGVCIYFFRNALEN